MAACATQMPGTIFGYRNGLRSTKRGACKGAPAVYMFFQIETALKFEGPNQWTTRFWAFKPAEPSGASVAAIRPCLPDSPPRLSQGPLLLTDSGPFALRGGPVCEPFLKMAQPSALTQNSSLSFVLHCRDKPTRRKTRGKPFVDVVKLDKREEVFDNTVRALFTS